MWKLIAGAAAILFLLPKKSKAQEAPSSGGGSQTPGGFFNKPGAATSGTGTPTAPRTAPQTSAASAASGAAAAKVAAFPQDVITDLLRTASKFDVSPTVGKAADFPIGAPFCPEDSRVWITFSDGSIAGVSYWAGKRTITDPSNPFGHRLSCAGFIGSSKFSGTKYAWQSETFGNGDILVNSNRADANSGLLSLATQYVAAFGNG